MKMTGIVLKSFDIPPTLAADAIEMKLKAISFSSKIKEVKSLPAEELGIEALAGLQTLVREIERCRKIVKERPLEMCKQIDQLAKDYVESLEVEIKRLKLELGKYAEFKRQEALIEERKRQEELRKIEEERRRKEEEAIKAAEAQAAAEIEAQRQLQAAENAKNAKAREAAERLAEEARKKAEEEARRLAEATAASQAKQDEIRNSLPVVAPKASGATTKFVWKYEVEDINQLFAHYPHAVELTDKKSVINMLINSMVIGRPEETPNIPGLRIWREADVTTRKKVTA